MILRHMLHRVSGTMVSLECVLFRTICPFVTHDSQGNRWGSGSGSGRQAGCCTRCCKRSFDEDEFADEQDRLRQRRENSAKQGKAAPNGEASRDEQQQKAQNGAEVVHEQPGAQQGMEVPRVEATEQPKPEQSN